jgi:hypothetical protein
VGEKPLPVHPISIPEQDEITQPFHFFRCQRNPKKEGTLLIKKRTTKTTGKEGSGRLPSSIITRKGRYPEEKSPEHREKPPNKNLESYTIRSVLDT